MQSRSTSQPARSWRRIASVRSAHACGRLGCGHRSAANHPQPPRCRLLCQRSWWRRCPGSQQCRSAPAMRCQLAAYRYPIQEASSCPTSGRHSCRFPLWPCPLFKPLCTPVGIPNDAAWCADLLYRGLQHFTDCRRQLAVDLTLRVQERADHVRGDHLAALDVFKLNLCVRLELRFPLLELKPGILFPGFQFGFVPLQLSLLLDFKLLLLRFGLLAVHVHALLHLHLLSFKLCVRPNFHVLNLHRNLARGLLLRQFGLHLSLRRVGLRWSLRRVAG